MFLMAVAGFFAARLSLRRRRMLGLASRLDTAERPAQFFQFAFVGQLLPLCDFDEFQDFIHLVVQFLERLGYESGMFHGLGNGGGRGGPEISRLHPLPLARRFRAAFQPLLTTRFARRLRDAGGFRFRSVDNFRWRFGFQHFRGLGLMRREFSGSFRMRLTETTGRIGFVFCGFGGFSCFHGGDIIFVHFR